MVVFGRDLHVLVDDGPANTAVPADVDAIEQDRRFDDGVAVDAHVGRQNAAANVAAADDAALTNHAVVGFAAPRSLAGTIVEDELRRRQLRLIGADRPFAVVQVQHRIDVD